MLTLKINRFTLKDGVRKEELLQLGFKSGGKFVQEDAEILWSVPLVDEVELYISFPKDITKWNDFDYILVMDNDFGQPYTPFYDFMNGGTCYSFSLLERVITKYNDVMGRLPFLKER